MPSVGMNFKSSMIVMLDLKEVENIQIKKKLNCSYVIIIKDDNEKSFAL